MRISDIRQLQVGAREFLQSMRLDNSWRFRFCYANRDSLIASSLAAMLGGLLGFCAELTERQRREWAGYINDFQNEDGWFEDSDISAANLRPGYLPDRARLHRTRHALFALYALGARPRRPWRFLENWLDADKRRAWCAGLNLTDYWYASNMMMDAAVFLLDQLHFQRDASVRRALDALLDFCDAHINPQTGFHDGGLSETRNAMAGAMHLYPVYVLMRRPILRAAAALRTVAALQQSDGLFGYESGTGGEDCLDYDAVMILSNLNFVDPDRTPTVRQALEKCLAGIMVCRNDDGGFACHRRPETYYFGTRTTAVPPGSSSLWATYSRLLTIAMIANNLFPATRPAWRMGANLMEIWDGGAGLMPAYPPGGAPETGAGAGVG